MAASTVGLVEEEAPALRPPPDVPARIRGEHEQLRHDLVHLVRDAEHAESGEPLAVERLRTRALDVLSRLRVHMRSEENALAPLLAAGDPWSALRRARLRTDHERQRAELAQLAVVVTAPVLVATELTPRLRRFVDELLADMAREEVDLLHVGLGDGEVPFDADDDGSGEVG